jgi:hypothetical protein
VSGYALRRLVGLALVTTGLTVVSMATPQAAHAAGGEPPSAIAVAGDGTSYVGFPDASTLLRLGPNGARKGSVPLDEDGPVSGLAVDGGRIWVDYGTSASLLTPGGRVVEHFEYRPARRCRGSAATRHGGIAVGGGRVWVAHRCDDTVGVYTPSGRRVALIDLPGKGHPRGIAYGAAQSGRGATVYVALPDSGRVIAYLAGQARRPWRTVRLRSPGGRKPQPGGVVVDRYGQVTVSDMANNGLYLLDSNHGFSAYRTLGHPPRASRAVGRLNRPTALAQARQGGRFSANLYIADTGNRRVQRWNTSGYTFWSKAVRPGSGGGGGGGGNGDGGGDGGHTMGPGGGTATPTTGAGPVNTLAPSILGTVAVGQTVTCYTGGWQISGGPAAGATRYAVTWRRGGAPITGATAATYLIGAADAGTSLTCVVTATNSRGQGTATSAARVVGAGGGPTTPTDPDDPDPTPSPGSPTNTTLPSVTGVGSVGSALTCNPGQWSDPAAALSYGWSRNGSPLPHTAAAKYVVLNADISAQLSCTVTAGNAHGSTAATSAERTIGGPSGHAPSIVAAPTVTGTVAVGETLTCLPGTWLGDPSLVPVWLRDGAIIGNGQWARTVVAADVGTAVQCLVIADNGWGLGAARSAPAGDAGCTGTPGVVINDGAASTTIPIVELRLRAPIGATTAQVSNDPTFGTSETMAIPADCTVDWTMGYIPGVPLDWTVYVRFNAGPTATYTDSIVVDAPA